MGRRVLFTFTCLSIGLVLSSVKAIKSLRIVSPLKALTIWDPETEQETLNPRRRFLPVFRARLQAEAEARKIVKEKSDRSLQASATSEENWAKDAASSDRRRRLADERFIEKASDGAAAIAQQAAASSVVGTKKNPNQYQFVGVVNPKVSGKPIKWYARKKPSGSKWSVRLVHVDEAAIVTDLFRRGEVDIFAKYKNTGKVDSESGVPIVKSEYTVRERSLRNLWNFSPKHFFTDSSGMYWRERRLRPGLYTDGNHVYEASYRYRDGRNGMHRLSTFQKFLASKGFDQKQKDKIQKHLKENAPDVVLEE